MLLKKTIYFIVLAYALLSAGCARYKNMLYFQESFQKGDTTGVNFQVADPVTTKAYPGDNLFINISGDASEQTELFNKQSKASANFNEISLYMQGYLIDDEGMIELPVIGKIQVGGFTLNQIQERVQEKMNGYFVGIIVDVRLLSFEVTLMGEVKSPGTYSFYKKKVSLLEVLARAGDLGPYADARHILVIRKTPGGSTTLPVNLTTYEVYQNPGFWIIPGDVVYVKPQRAKMVSINSPTISIILSGLTTLLLLITYTSYTNG